MDKKINKLEELNYKKRFMNGFHILERDKNKYEVWSDLMALFSIEISNTITRNLKDTEPFKSTWEQREKEYIRVAKKYNEKERKRIIPQMFALIVLELEKNPDQDLLGSIYMSLEISSKNKGQFFTPYSICKLMSDVTIDKKTLSKAIKEKGYAVLNDCAIGGGATLISAVNKSKDLFRKLNYQNHIMIVGQDIDITCVRMAYIQLSLLGVAGYIKHSNTITNPENDFVEENNVFWITPITFNDIWQTRIFFRGGYSRFFR